MTASTPVSEVHAYPIRPTGFEEPLFPTPASRRAVAEHLLEAPWLTRASELLAGSGEGPHRYEEPVEVVAREDGACLLVFPGPGPRCGGRRRPRRRRVARVVGRWREVRGWWEKGGGSDRLMFRLEIEGDPRIPGSLGVVDVALDRSSGRWALVGVVD
jgi:hypothetical protein